jgi:creatinine amidohydrolase
MMTIRMEEMTCPDIRSAIDRGFATVVVAVGSTEQHGPHLPTMTDTRIGDAVAERVARKLGNALQARSVPVGVSEHHLAFGGTVSIKPDTLKLILRDYTDSLVRCGFRRIVLLPMHGGNFASVKQVIDGARDAYPGVEVTGYADVMGFLAALNSVSAEFGVSVEEAGAHAGENETSMMMALEPALVVCDRFAPGYLGPMGDAEFKIILERGMPALTQSGVLGDPRRASRDKGEIYIERLADFLVEQIGRGSVPSSVEKAP